MHANKTFMSDVNKNIRILKTKQIPWQMVSSTNRLIKEFETQKHLKSKKKQDKLNNSIKICVKIGIPFSYTFI